MQNYLSWLPDLENITKLRWSYTWRGYIISWFANLEKCNLKFYSRRCRRTKSQYVPSVNQWPKACSAPSVLPGFSIIGSNWLLHMVVLSCTVIGWVDLVELWLHSRWIPDTQTKHGGDHRISVWSGEKQFELSHNLPELWKSVKVFRRQQWANIPENIHTYTTDSF